MRCTKERVVLEFTDAGPTYVRPVRSIYRYNTGMDHYFDYFGVVLGSGMESGMALILILMTADV